MKLSPIVTVEVLDHDLGQEHGILDHLEVLTYFFSEEEQVRKQHRVHLHVQLVKFCEVCVRASFVAYVRLRKGGEVQLAGWADFFIDTFIVNSLIEN